MISTSTSRAASKPKSARRPGTPCCQGRRAAAVPGAATASALSAGQRSQGPGAERRALSGPAPPVGPAGLTARARPKARPDGRAANLQDTHLYRPKDHCQNVAEWDVRHSTRKLLL